ncbi:Hint domain-containing protein [Oceanithermus sp.]|uniref:Hint domain-containing protein n=1 Tax=Oceanithermus sp. TaxID=2268145 RepID=UPI00257F229A|nr:Hint domain-containing protein [Oceanithermus sp.]
MSEQARGRNAGHGPGGCHHIHEHDAGLCEGTRVMTLEGNLPVEYLAPGDRIVTRQGARILRRIQVQPLQDGPVVVRRGALGPGLPAAELRLAPAQAVHLRGWRGRRLYGSDLSCVPVARLIDGESICRSEQPEQPNAYRLELDEPAVIYAEGVEVMSAALPVRAVHIAAE